MKELQAEEPSMKLLRLSIEAGGCSGFQYNFSLDDKTNNDDRLLDFIFYSRVYLWLFPPILGQMNYTKF